MNSLKRIGNEITYITQANRIILNYPNHKAEKNKVNLHYYHADWQDGVECNLGDYLSEIVVRALCERNGFTLDKTIDKTKHLYGIGSILQMGYQDATVWGTGFAFELSKFRGLPHRKRKLDIRSVRGPKTRRVLLQLGFDCPEIYGDPGILMPLLYEPRQSEHTSFIIIPHYSVEGETRKWYGEDHILSMNTFDYKKVIDRICSTDKVISSSLHGIILAEAYGIPAVFYQDRPQKFNFKYEDWYESTERHITKPANSIKEGISMIQDKIDPRRLKKMQNELIEKFPADLWGGGTGK